VISIAAPKQPMPRASAKIVTPHLPNTGTSIPDACSNVSMRMPAGPKTIADVTSTPIETTAPKPMPANEVIRLIQRSDSLHFSSSAPDE
jgi:hypothetical protein